MDSSNFLFLFFQAALLEVIKAQRHKNAEGFVKRMQEGHSDEEDVFVNNHLLLFTSALVPKAMSSILSSFAFEVAKPELVRYFISHVKAFCAGILIVFSIIAICLPWFTVG